MKSLNVLIADDHEVVRLGTRALIESRQEWTVVGEATNGNEAVTLSQELKPHVVVLDINMPHLSGLEATRQIKHHLPDTEVLILTAVDTEQVVHDVLAAGARAYLLKSDSLRHLVDAVQALGEHRPFLEGKASGIVFDACLKDAHTEDVPSLTPREREIVRLLAGGRSNKEASGALGISVRTVETHRANVMNKLGLKAFSELVRYAIRNKIILA